MNTLWLFTIFNVYILSAIFSRAQPPSLACLLECKVTTTINEEYVTQAVARLVDDAKLVHPEISKIKFKFIGSEKIGVVCLPGLILNNVKFQDALLQIGSVYRHRVEYGISNCEVTFTAVTDPGPDPERLFLFSDELSRAMHIEWKDNKSVEASLLKFGAYVNVSAVDLSRHSVTVCGPQRELDYLDMVVLVYGRGAAGRFRQ